MKHWRKGRYIISEVTSIFGKKQYWISRINSITAIYCWTYISEKDNESQLANFNGYIALFNMRVDGKQYVEEYEKDMEEKVEAVN